MSSEERARILRMVAEGKLSIEQAAGLLDALEPPARTEYPRPIQPEAPRPPSMPSRALVIQVSDDDESRVNLRIPLGLARAAGKFMPRSAQQILKEHGIDIDHFLDDLGPVQDGTLLEVRDSDTRVFIAVE